MPRSGREEAEILGAVRDALLENPHASMAEIGRSAGVGMSTLYRRWPNREALLRAVCTAGQETYLRNTRDALDGPHESPEEAFTWWLQQLVDANTHVLVARLAGLFKPDARQNALSREMFDQTAEIYARLARAEGIIQDVSAMDVALLLEGIGSIRVGTPERDREVRRRLLTIVLNGILAGERRPLPGTPMSPSEQSARWETGDGELTADT